MFLHFLRIEWSQCCQHTKLQRLCKVFTQNQGRRQYGVEVGHSKFLVRNVCIMNAIFDSAQTAQLCVPLCSRSHTTCRNFSQNSGRQKDYYKILHLDVNASASEIKSAYFTLSKKYHPDLNKGTSTDSFLNLVEAYDVLGKESTRKEYDDTISYKTSKTTPQKQDLSESEQFYRQQEYWNKQQEQEIRDHEQLHRIDQRNRRVRQQRVREQTNAFSFYGLHRPESKSNGEQEKTTTADNLFNFAMCFLGGWLIYRFCFRAPPKNDRTPPPKSIRIPPKKNKRNPSAKMKKQPALKAPDGITNTDSVSHLQSEKKI